MRFLLPRALLFVAVLLAAPLPKANAYLDSDWVETYYVAPSASVLAVPTTYVVESSYVLPTTYYTPTAYTTTSLTPTYYLSSAAYVVPTSYWSTGYYVRRPLFRRPLFTPRWNYYPALTATSWSFPVVASTSYASNDCGPAPSAPMQAPPRPSGPSRSTSSGGGGPPERPSAVVDSVPANEPGFTGDTSSPPRGTTPVTPLPTDPPLPASPAPDAGEPPVAPSGAAPGETTRRDSLKPSVMDPAVRQVASSRGILAGRVVTAESGRAEAGVRVIVVDHRQRFDNRVAMTDALGRYAINLPEGDWTVRVEMPSRRTYDVSELTVSGGQITDSGGRNIPSLIIKR